MSLELDTRQRAMLQEMGIHVWLPAADAPPAEVAPAQSAAPVAQPIAKAVATPVVTPRPVASPVPTPAPMARSAAPSAVVANAAAPAVQGLAWAALADAASSCQACGLCAGRTHTTLQATAVPQADWLVVGDAPTEEDDQLGQPFTGAAGQLLDNMLKAVGAQRGAAGAQGAYVTHIVKCRPPLGRVPQSAELAQCEAYLQQEIALVQPKIIIAMGRLATQVLLAEHPEQATQALGRQRGTVYRYQGTPVVTTYPPSTLLRASADKAKAWADLCLAAGLVNA
jgi:uracil-DNA glycosylase